jgi:hypothetical protein
MVVAAALAVWSAAALPVAWSPTSAAAQSPGTELRPSAQVQAIALGPGRTHPQFEPGAGLTTPLRTLDSGDLRTAKLNASGALQPTAPGPRATSGLAPSPQAAVFNGINKLGLAAADEAGCCTPPDTTGAIGPNHYVEMVNQLIAVYDRSLNLRASSALMSFLSPPGATVITDPQIQWDAPAQRWLIAALTYSVTANYLVFAWSKTTDPSDLLNGWCRFSVDTGPLLNDYPKLGHDDNYLIVGANAFSGATFVTATIWVIPKPGIGDASCAPPTAWRFGGPSPNQLKNADGTLAFTPVPANITDASANGYVVSAHTPSLGPGQTKVMVWHTAKATPPQMVGDGDITVNAFDFPADVPQPGTPYLLSTSDARLTQAVAHRDPSAGNAGAVWTQHTIAGPGGRSVVRWYEFLPATLTVRQQGVIQHATDFVFNGAISPSSAGSDAVIFYNRGSASQLPVIGAQGRVVTTPLGSMDPGELNLATSSDPDTDFSCTPTTSCRWGDYSGATPDPVNCKVVWGSNQITGPVVPGKAQWKTQNFAAAVVPGSPTNVTAVAGHLPAVVAAPSSATR